MIILGQPQGRVVKADDGLVVTFVVTLPSLDDVICPLEHGQRDRQA